MSRVLQFSDRGFVPGGHVASLDGQSSIHNLIYETERIQVNEDSWFPFFKKSRWWASARGTSMNDAWYFSVDNPRVWEELRIALELANRILNTLIKDRHTFLQTFLFGKLTTWEAARNELFDDQPLEPAPNTNVLLSYPFYKQKFTEKYPGQPCDMDIILTYPEEKYREMLSIYAAQQDWALSLIRHDVDDQREAGRTYMGGLNTIILNADLLESLAFGKITLAERVTLLYKTANTILHELAHAIIDRRATEDDSPFNALDIYEYQATEPFVDFASQAECGFYMEAMVFGGPWRDHPCYSGSVEVPLGGHRVTWPFVDVDDWLPSELGGVVPGLLGAAKAAESRLFLVPAIWCSMMVSEKFWSNDAIIRKSDNFFHQTTMDWFISRHKRQDSSIRPPPTLNIDDALPSINPGIVEIIRDWNFREDLFKKSRDGWYDNEKAIWEHSTWGIMMDLRSSLHHFSQEMKKPVDQRDIYQCANKAWFLSLCVPWTSGRPAYVNSLALGTNHWAWHCIGLLMLACIPLRSETLYRPAQEPKFRWHYLKPSSETYPGKSKFLPQLLEQGEIHEIADPNYYCNPFYDNSALITYSQGLFNHCDYLDIVLSLLNYFSATSAIISTPWLNEIIRVEKNIRAHRLMNSMTQVDPDATWVTDAWDFQVPEYDPTAMSIWVDDEALSGWREVAFHANIPFMQRQQ
ncbi:hypothetical protein F4808DRAFT_193647 [Astrocystis sublimbata]|nr:hypothetical protein F4808DRAFT_193647 [Astrocystis sublimbata]